MFLFNFPRVHNFFNFFFKPFGKVQRWLVQGVNPEAHGIEQRQKTLDLAPPSASYRHPLEARVNQGPGY